jgi:hypothetical protein
LRWFVAAREASEDLFLDVWVGDVVLRKSSDTHGLGHSRLRRPREELHGIFDHLQMQSGIP